MGYVGNQQSEGFSQVPAKQDLTGTAGTSLTLSHAVASAEGIDLFINNVRQEPTTAYSVTGTAVTLTGSVVASDDIYVVYNSLALQTTVPPDASVSTAKIIDGSVTKAKIGTTELDLATIKDSTGTNTAMTIDSSGRVFMPAKPVFSVSKTTNQNETTANSFVAVNWDSVDVNVGNCYSANVFTAPVAGNYFLSYNVRVDNTEQSGSWNIVSIHFSNDPSFAKQSRTYVIHSPKGVHQSIVYSGIIEMDANQTAQVYFYSQSDQSWSIVAYGNYSGYLIG